MPREIVALHVGQAGNQIGSEFWRTVGCCPASVLLWTM